MRTLARGLLAVCLVACGGKDNKVIDAPGGGDDAPPDAPDFLKCASPVNGTTVSLRALPDKLPDNIGVLVTSPPNDLRLFVVDRNGQIFIYQDEHIVATPFIDLQDDNGGPVVAADGTSTGETGLLGMAFHPKFAENRTFFVFYTRRENGDATNPLRDVLARCTASEADPMKADPTCTEVLVIPDFASNHNGGMIEFGKDGFLYIGTGDGGLADDPHGNGQALVDSGLSVALLAKMLRIDVDNKAAGKEYGIPADNPFAGGGGAPEIFAYGLRNPWRWSFDRATGDMWIGDVGQGTIEELDYIKAGELKGKNFGWSLCEGSLDFKTNTCPRTPAFTFPQDERTHGGDGWVSITGGQVYRGTCYPDIVGTYYYTDFQHGGLTKATANADGTLAIQDLPGSFPGKLTSIHEVATGEIYATDLTGTVYHLEAGP